MGDQPHRPASTRSGGQYATTQRQASGPDLSDTGSGIPPHDTEVLPYTSSSGRRSEIDTYTATIRPMIADLPLRGSLELDEASRAAQIDKVAPWQALECYAARTST